MPFLSSQMDGKYLDQLDNRQKQDNLAWLQNSLKQPMPGDPPATPARVPAPAEADSWWNEFLASTTADVANVLTRGLTLGIVSGKNLPVLGSIIEKYQTPEDRKMAVQKVGEFAGELLSGALVAGPILGPVGRAAAGLLPKAAGPVVRGAVRAGTEGAALGAAQAVTGALRGEETPLSAAEKIVGGAILGGLFGGAIGKTEAFIAARAAQRAKTVALGELQTSLAKAAKAKDLAETGSLEAMQAREAAIAAETKMPTGAVPAEPIATPEGFGRLAQKAEVEAAQREYEAYLSRMADTSKVIDPYSAEVPVQAKARDLFKLADKLEQSLPEMPPAAQKTMIADRAATLREQGRGLAVIEAAEGATQDAVGAGLAADVQAAVTQAASRKIVLTGDPTGNIEAGFSTLLAKASVGALVGGPIGAATGDTPEDRIRNAIIGAGIGAVLTPVLFDRVAGFLGKKIAAIPEGAPGAAAGEVGNITAPPPAPAAPKPQARIRIVPASSEEATRLIEESAGKAHEVGGFVFHVPWKELFTRGDLEQGVQAFTRVFKERVGAERVGAMSEEVRHSLAAKLDMGDLLGKSAAAGWNRIEVTALGTFLHAADDEWWRLLTLAKSGTDETLRDFKNQSGIMLALTKKLFGVTSEWGYTGHALQEVQDATPAARSSIKMISQLLGMDSAEAQLKLGVTPKRWHSMMLSLAEERGTAQKIAGWGTFAKQINNGLIEAWINGLLSNPVTHSANFLGNVGPLFAGPAERYMAAKFSTGAVGSVVPGEASEMMYGLFSGFGDAFKAASKSFRSGESAWDALATKVETPVRQAITAGAYGVDAETVFGKGLDLLGTTIRTPGRALTAADDFFKMLNYRMEYHALTYRAARIAHPEGGSAFTDALAALRADPTDAILEQATRFAEVQTFTNPLGDFGQAVQRVSNSHPAVKLILPFIRTPTNLVKFAWERTPGLNLLNSQYRADLLTAGAARELALAKMSLGAMVAGTAAVVAAGGFLTGNGPTDKTLRANLEQTGWQPYSLKIGDTYYAFSRLDPIGMTLGAIADFADIVGHLSETDATALGQAIVLSITRNVTSKTWVQGLSNVLEAATDQDGRYLNTFFTLQARSLIPSVLGQVTRSYVDPELHEVHSIIDALKSRIPGYSSTLPPRRNIFADPVTLEGGLGPDIASPIYTKTVSGDRVAQEISQNHMRVALPPDYVYGTNPPENLTAEQRVSQGIGITPKERDRWILLSGKEVKNGTGQDLRAALEELIASPSYKAGTDGPDGTKSVMVHRIVNFFQGEGKRRLLDENPELAAKVLKRQQERIVARTPADIFSTLGR